MAGRQPSVVAPRDLTGGKRCVKHIQHGLFAVFAYHLTQPEMYVGHFDVVLGKGVVGACPSRSTQDRHSLRRQFLGQNSGKAGRDAGYQRMNRSA